MKISKTSKSGKQLHHGWIIVFTGVAILFACLGLGRFALGMLLPSMGFITLFFGAGQIAGPAIAGFLADITGSFGAGFWLCAGLTALAVLLSFFLKSPAAQ
ncbi:MAG: YbfB/YjiJ family MFS transporter [Desulfobacteraceae bacterium]|nr:YbfB/YjiJ family MFS transporter [Desulfobacteraceae bacterium]